MPSDRETLIEFGFEEARIDWALKATAGRGLQPAIDHIVANMEKPVPVPGETSATDGMDEDDEETQRAIELSKGEDGAEAKSIKCSECGKLFRSTALAEFHAEKSGHDQFEESVEEIKPLTEEETAAKLAELKTAMAAKRAVKAKQEAEEAKANEALRRKAGKDAAQIREDLKTKAAFKEADQRKKEKLEDAKAKAAIKAQIEADKKDRAARAAAEKATREGRSVIPEASTSTQPAPIAAAAGVKHVYTETRLQIRLVGGGNYTTTLPVSSSLQEVAEYLAGQTMKVNSDLSNVTFSVTYPRKIFTRADWKKTLKDLDLVPSAVLMANVS